MAAQPLSLGRMMALRWTVVAVLAPLLLVAAAFFMLPGCAPGLDGARQAIASAAKVDSAILTAIVKYDGAHQQSIVDEGVRTKQPDIAAMKLAEYRGKRAKLVEVITLSIGAIDTASAVLALVVSGKAPLQTLTDAVGQLVNLAGDVQLALAAWGVAVPGLP